MEAKVSAIFLKFQAVVLLWLHGVLPPNFAQLKSLSRIWRKFKGIFLYCFICGFFALKEVFSLILAILIIPNFFSGSLDPRYGEGNGTQLQYSCLENPMDGGAWWAAVHGVARCWTRLSDFTFTFHFHTLEKEMATDSSVLAWRIPGTGEHRVRHDWSDLAAAAAADPRECSFLLEFMTLH